METLKTHVQTEAVAESVVCKCVYNKTKQRRKVYERERD